MNEFLANINFDQLITALQETLFMTFGSLIIAVILGFVIGTVLFITSSNGLYKNRFLNRLIDIFINVFRAVPYIILMILLIDITRFLVGTMLGAKAAIPSLALSASVFYARMVVVALQDVDKGTIEAAKAMGATNTQIIFKVLYKEAMPSIISGITITAVNLVGYTAMAGAIGGGGLGFVAYTYGFARRKMPVLYAATIMIVVIVFLIQGIGDYIVKKIDKR